MANSVRLHFEGEGRFGPRTPAIKVHCDKLADCEALYKKLEGSGLSFGWEKGNDIYIFTDQRTGYFNYDKIIDVLNEVFPGEQCLLWKKNGALAQEVINNAGQWNLKVMAEACRGKLPSPEVSCL